MIFFHLKSFKILRFGIAIFLFRILIFFFVGDKVRESPSVYSLTVQILATVRAGPGKSQVI